MTTVAFDGERIACDSQITYEDQKKFGEKFLRVEGRLLLVVGYVHCLYEAAEQVLKGQEIEVSEEDTHILEVLGDGTVRVHAKGDAPWRQVGWSTWGSGASIASGGIVLGMRADEAVALACEVDTGTGGRVHCWNVSSLKPVRPRKLRRLYAED